MARKLQLQTAIVLAGAAIAAAAVVVWNRSTADDGAIVRLDTPGEYADPANSNPPNDGERLPDVTLPSIDGSDVAIAPDGRPLVVNLWYSNCPPCARELVYLANVHADFGDAVRFVGVNTLDDAETTRRFAAERGVEYELVLDEDDVIGDALGVVQMPVTLFVDADGTIVAQAGTLTEADLRDHVAALLA